jgi:hypothetical protein
MIGAPLVGSGIAHGIFWIMLAVGFHDLGRKGVLGFAALWIGGYRTLLVCRLWRAVFCAVRGGPGHRPRSNSLQGRRSNR